jgi:hypothetical protein
MGWLGDILDVVCDVAGAIPEIGNVAAGINMAAHAAFDDPQNEEEQAEHDARMRKDAVGLIPLVGEVAEVAGMENNFIQGTKRLFGASEREAPSTEEQFYMTADEQEHKYMTHEMEAREAAMTPEQREEERQRNLRNIQAANNDEAESKAQASLPRDDQGNAIPPAVGPPAPEPTPTPAAPAPDPDWHPPMLAPAEAN